MDPVSIGFLAIVFGLVLAFWPQIMVWVRDDLVPWLGGLHPGLAAVATEAFIFIDDKIATPARVGIRRAWEKLREIIVGIVVEFVEILPEKVRRIIKTYYSLPQQPNKPMVRETVVDLDRDEIPSEVREAFFKKKTKTYTINVHELRDKELDVLAPT